MKAFMSNKNNIYIYNNLYSDEKIEKLISDKVLINNFFKVEELLAKANSDCNIIPKKAYNKISLAIQNSKNKKINFTKSVKESGLISLEILKKIKSNLSKEYHRYLHFGATSQDIIDTAFVLQLKESKSLFLNKLKEVSSALAYIIADNKNTLTVGRTRKQNATVTTFGLKACNWLIPMLNHTKRLRNIYDKNLLFVQLGGPVGNLSLYNNKGLLVKKKLSKLLALKYTNYSWHNLRDNFVEFANVLTLITGSIGKIGKDILIMSQSEINEIKINNSGKSTSMPHKNNPILAELLVTIANLNANNISIMHNTLMHENERDGITWMMEWETLVRMIKLSYASLNHLYCCLKLIKVNKEVMKKNLDNTYGLAMSDYYYNILSQYYSNKELKLKFLKFINKSINKKKHLAYIIHQDLGDKLNLKKLLNYNNCLGVNNKIIESVLESYKKHFN